MDSRHVRHRVAMPLIAFALLAALAAIDVSYSQNVEDELVRAEIVADVHSITPGVPFHVGVRFDIAKNWHINWTNPGDAGLAPSMSWTLPDGFTAEPMGWPFPSRYIEEGPLVIFGYSDSMILWTTVTPPAGLDPGARIMLRAGVDWLACRDVCVPGESTVALELPVEASARPDTTWARVFEESRHLLPALAPEWTLSARYDDQEIVIEISPARPIPGLSPVGVYFFPTEQGVIENALPQRLESAGAGFLLTITRSRMVHAQPHRLTGVLVSGNGWGSGRSEALRVDVVLDPR